jgi:Na+-transporting methylmalonyl-CoA/oxaloacetate decarboxylase beta subunit
MRIRIEKRLEIPRYAGIVVPIISVAFALLIMGVILLVFFMGRLGNFHRPSGKLSRLTGDADLALCK